MARTPVRNVNAESAPSTYDRQIVIRITTAQMEFVERQLVRMRKTDPTRTFRVADVIRQALRDLQRKEEG